MSFQKNEKPCKYGCNFIVIWRGKTGQPGSTGFFEKGTNTEHTFNRCRELKANRGPQQQQVSVFPQQQQLPPPVQQHSQPKGGEEAAPNGITPYSSYIMASDTRKEVREVKKQIQTLTDIVDSMAQKIELILKQTGYPKPEPILNEEEREKEVKELAKTLARPSTKEDEEQQQALWGNKEQEQPEEGDGDDVRANPGFAEFLDNKKKIEEEYGFGGEEDRQKDLEEANNNIIAEKQKEVINPYRLPKIEEEDEIPGEPDDLDAKRNGWTPISEKFECHNCRGPKFNGYEKYGTRICLDCKEGIDAQNL